MADKSAAIVTIKDGHKMNARGRRSIASWLRKQAAWFEKHGDKLAPTFRARYIYR